MKLLWPDVFISGLFVRDSLARRGTAKTSWPSVHGDWAFFFAVYVSIFVVTPIAYYASFLRFMCQED